MGWSTNDYRNFSDGDIFTASLVLIYLSIKSKKRWSARKKSVLK